MARAPESPGTLRNERESGSYTELKRGRCAPMSWFRGASPSSEWPPCFGHCVGAAAGAPGKGCESSLSGVSWSNQCLLDRSLRQGRGMWAVRPQKHLDWNGMILLYAHATPDRRRGFSYPRAPLARGCQIACIWLTPRLSGGSISIICNWSWARLIKRIPKQTKICPLLKFIA